jgi:6-pyruvoyltetrahydropterin 2'-reductase
MIPVVEIFTSIQGEGPGLGTPSLFIRLGGCNLRCQFRGTACDTPYAVFTPEQLDRKDPSMKFGYLAWQEHGVQDLARIILAQPVKHLVWTGGEPLLWQDQIIRVHKALHEQSFEYTAEVETNGTIPVDPGFKAYIQTVFNVSVKLASSAQEPGYDTRRINAEAIRSFSAADSVYKFVVVDPDSDLAEIRQVLGMNLLDVYLMPEGAGREAIIQNSPAVAAMAIANGFRFSPREHIMIWDSKKGI